MRKRENASEFLRKLIDESMKSELKFEYFTSIDDYNFDSNGIRLTGLAKIKKLGIPTIPNPFIFSHKVFEYYKPNRKIPLRALEELKRICDLITRNRDTITVRHSIHSESNPNIELSIANRVNLPDFDSAKKAVIDMYETVMNMGVDTKDVEFSIVIHPFYDGAKCDLLHTKDENGLIHIEGVFGQHIKLITRGEIEPDVCKLIKILWKLYQNA